MRDENEFLAALVAHEERPLSPGIPFNVELQEVEPIDDNDFSPGEDIHSLYESDAEFDQKASGLTTHEYIKWRKAALCMSSVSLLLQSLISVVAIIEGLKVDSSGTFAFGVEGALDMCTTIIVLWRFFGKAGMCAVDNKREFNAVVALAVVMVMFSTGLIVKVAFILTKEKGPFKEFELMIICNIGFAVYAVLAWLKFMVGRRLKSKAVIMDAYSTFGAAGMALALLFSLLVYHFTALWFLDSIVAIIISLLLFTYGVRTLFKIYRSRKKTKM